MRSLLIDTLYHVGIDRRDVILVRDQALTIHRCVMKKVFLRGGLWVGMLFASLAVGCMDPGEDPSVGNTTQEELGENSDSLTCDSYGTWNTGYDGSASLPNPASSGSYWGSTSSLNCNQYTSCGSGNDTYLTRVTVAANGASSRNLRAVAKWVDSVPTNKVDCENSYLQVQVRRCGNQDCSWLPTGDTSVVTTQGWWNQLSAQCFIPDATTTYFSAGSYGNDYYKVAATAYRWVTSPFYFKSYKRVSGGLQVQ